MFGAVIEWFSKNLCNCLDSGVWAVIAWILIKFEYGSDGDIGIDKKNAEGNIGKNWFHELLRFHDEREYFNCECLFSYFLLYKFHISKEKRISFD